MTTFKIKLDKFRITKGEISIYCSLVNTWFIFIYISFIQSVGYMVEVKWMELPMFKDVLWCSLLFWIIVLLIQPFRYLMIEHVLHGGLFIYIDSNRFFFYPAMAFCCWQILCFYEKLNSGTLLRFAVPKWLFNISTISISVSIISFFSWTKPQPSWRGKVETSSFTILLYSIQFDSMKLTRFVTNFFKKEETREFTWVCEISTDMLLRYVGS